MADHEETFARVVDALKEPVLIDPALDQRVMAQIASEPRPVKVRGWTQARWTIRLSPLGALASAAALVGVMFAGSLLMRRSAPSPSQAAVAQSNTQEVTQFVLVAPTARSVALVGDFNDWNATLLARQASDGVWWVTVKLPPGRYRYAFIVDGTNWRSDPRASGEEDEFGRPNSVVTVGAGT